VPIEPKLKAKFSRPWSEPTPTVDGFSPSTNAEHQDPKPLAPAITDEESR
jgi:hypothetical protein